jgi:hypothetical protein
VASAKDIADQAAIFLGPLAGPGMVGTHSADLDGRLSLAQRFGKLFARNLYAGLVPGKQKVRHMVGDRWYVSRRQPLNRTKESPRF